MKLKRLILAWLVGFVVWAVLGGLLYMNPLVGGYFSEFEGSSGVKVWDDTAEYLIYMHLGGLVEVLIYAIVFAMVRTALPTRRLFRGLAFSLILVVMMVLPRFFTMWIQSTYPDPLLVIDLVNGVIMSVGLGLVFGFVFGDR